MAHEAEKKEVVDNDKAYANNAEDYNNRDKKGDEKIQVVDMHYDQPDKSWNQNDVEHPAYEDGEVAHDMYQNERYEKEKNNFGSKN